MSDQFSTLSFFSLQFAVLHFEARIFTVIIVLLSSFLSVFLTAFSLKLSKEPAAFSHKLLWYHQLKLNSYWL